MQLLEKIRLHFTLQSGHTGWVTIANLEKMLPNLREMESLRL